MFHFSRSIYLVVLKICRLILCVLGQVLTLLFESSSLVMGPENGQGTCCKGIEVLDQSEHTLALMKEAFTLVPNPNLEYMLRSVASKLAQIYIDKIAFDCETIETLKLAMNKSITTFMPTLDMIWTTIHLAWAVTGSNQHAFDDQSIDPELLNNDNEKSIEVEDMCGMN